jgi:hypothetical protein
MATKKQAGGKDASESGGQAEMPSGDMHQTVNEGLSEMPSGGATDAPLDPGSGMGGGLMPGEGADAAPGGPHSDMSSKGMTST